MRNSFLLLCFVLSVSLFAQTPVNYATQIAPIFEVTYGCTGCHGGTNNLFLTPYANIFTTGNHKPVIIPGDTNSILIQKVKGIASFGARMPFGGDPISDADLRILVRWVKEGAKQNPTIVRREFEPIATYQLNQNFPNPFNPSTKIRFSIGHSEEVTLKVFDVLGKEIAILVHQTLSAGNYEADFAATSLPTGVYIYQLHAGNYNEIRKMILAK